MRTRAARPSPCGSWAPSTGSRSTGPRLGLPSGTRPRTGTASEPGVCFAGCSSEQAERLRELVEQPVQTNEVGRCAALLPGFLEVARETGLPLRLLEVGASAGLILRWDAYRYEAEGFAWGSADSPLRIGFELERGELPEATPVEVAERRGCDASPIDLSGEEGRLTLLSYIWPDQVARLERAACRDRARGGSARRGRAGGGAGVDRVAARRSGARPGDGRLPLGRHAVPVGGRTRGASRRRSGRPARGRAPRRLSPGCGWSRRAIAPSCGSRTGQVARTGTSAVAGYHGTPVDLSRPRVSLRAHRSRLARSPARTSAPLCAASSES